MKQVMWMAAGCVGGWLLAALVFGRALELFFGMFGPLVAASTAWLAVERTHRRQPMRVNAVLMRAFGAKMVFFAAYVVVVASVWPIEFAPFAVSFGVFFLALQMASAAWLRGLSTQAS